LTMNDDDLPEPPPPFQHRNSEDDLIAYYNALENDTIGDLYRKWHAEDQEAEIREAEKNQAIQEKLQLKQSLASISEKLEATKMASKSANRKWLDRQEAANYLGVSSKTIDRMREDGRLKAYIIEGTSSFRFKVAELDALMER